MYSGALLVRAYLVQRYYLMRQKNCTDVSDIYALLEQARELFRGNRNINLVISIEKALEDIEAWNDRSEETTDGLSGFCQLLRR